MAVPRHLGTHLRQLGGNVCFAAGCREGVLSLSDAVPLPAVAEEEMQCTFCCGGC